MPADEDADTATAVLEAIERLEARMVELLAALAIRPTRTRTPTPPHRAEFIQRARMERLQTALRAAGPDGLNGRERFKVIGRKYPASVVDEVSEKLVDAGIAAWRQGPFGNRVLVLDTDPPPVV